MNKARIGSSLDAMFEDLGELEEVRILTQKKILARQIEQVRRAGNVSISEMARRMGTSRMAVHSLLDPSRPTMTIDSVSRAAAALGVVRIDQEDVEFCVIDFDDPQRNANLRARPAGAHFSVGRFATFARRHPLIRADVGLDPSMHGHFARVGLVGIEEARIA